MPMQEKIGASPISAENRFSPLAQEMVLRFATSGVTAVPAHASSDSGSATDLVVSG